MVKPILIFLTVAIAILGGILFATLYARHTAVAPAPETSFSPLPSATPTPSVLSDVSALIHVFSPQPNDIVFSPLVVKGEARGYWYFEASFPIYLLDGNGKMIVQQTPVQAKGEWMTEDFVPFEIPLGFTKPETSEGTLVLHNDNPSGLPERDKEIRIPLKFSQTGNYQKACKPTGCSGQICSDEDIMTTCEYKEEYACYQNAKCERQANGTCGWIQTSALQVCLQEKNGNQLPAQ